MSDPNDDYGQGADAGTLDQHPRPTQAALQETQAPAAMMLEMEESLQAAEAEPAPATEVSRTRITKTGSNGDEDRFLGGDGKANYIGNFHKGLPHDDLGEVVLGDYRKYLDILKTRKNFDQIPLGLGRKLVNPQGGLATDTENPDPSTLRMLAAPSLDSAEAAAEAVELYWMALLRDVPFVRFGTDAGVDRAAQELSALADFTGPKSGGQVTPRVLFRGTSPGDTAGPFLSQLLLRDANYGSLKVRLRQQSVFGESVVGVGNADYLTRYDEWLATQRGKASFPPDKLDGYRRYIQTMRDLARYVQVDGPYEPYLNACLILLDAKAPVDDGNPYRATLPDAATQIGFGTFGGPHILALVAEVVTRALKAIWYQKWYVHRRLRPEAYCGLIELTQSGKKAYPVHAQALNSKVVQEARSKFGTALLPMAYPEGSPTHPAYGAGHATIAGACATILKAWFKGDAPLPFAPMVPSEDGRTLVPYMGPDAGSLTIGGEINKLAANISGGRNMAGVHWRSDYAQAIRLGEQVALCLLKAQSTTFHESGWFLKVVRFDGSTVAVRKGEVVGTNGKPVKDLLC